MKCPKSSLVFYAKSSSLSFLPFFRLRPLDAQDGLWQVLHDGVRHHRHPPRPRHVQLHRRAPQQLRLHRHQQAAQGAKLFVYSLAVRLLFNCSFTLQVLKARQSETTETDLIVVAGTLTLFVATCGAAVFSYYEGGFHGYAHRIRMSRIQPSLLAFGANHVLHSQFGEVGVGQTKIWECNGAVRSSNELCRCIQESILILIIMHASLWRRRDACTSLRKLWEANKIVIVI